MSTLPTEFPASPADYIIAAREGLKASGLAASMTGSNTPPEIIAAIITAQAIDRQTATVKAVGDALIDILNSQALTRS